MPAEDHPRYDEHEDITEEYSFDELAKGLANGSLTRGRMLKLAGATFLVGLGLLPGIANIAQTKKKKHARRNNNKRPPGPIPEVPCGTGFCPAIATCCADNPVLSCCGPGTKCCPPPAGGGRSECVPLDASCCPNGATTCSTAMGGCCPTTHPNCCPDALGGCCPANASQCCPRELGGGCCPPGTGCGIDPETGVPICPGGIASVPMSTGESQATVAQQPRGGGQRSKDRS